MLIRQTCFGNLTPLFFLFLFLKGSKASDINTICYKFSFHISYNGRFSSGTILQQNFFPFISFHVSLLTMGSFHAQYCEKKIFPCFSYCVLLCDNGLISYLIQVVFKILSDAMLFSLNYFCFFTDGRRVFDCAVMPGRILCTM